MSDDMNTEIVVWGDDDEVDKCEAMGCDARLVGEDDDETTYYCDRCGAEWWEEKDEH